MDDWISIEDKLPLSGKEIWVYDEEDGVIIGLYSVIHGDGRWCHIYGDDDGLGDDTLYNVTHWKPLERPQKPIEVNEQAIILTEAICRQNSMITDNIGLSLSISDLRYIYQTVGRHFSMFIATDQYMPSVYDITKRYLE
jgi:hypothetical protein